MKHGSLFSGIGGAELAASWMGWENVFHCEINKYNQKLLKQHFPKSISHEDIKTTDFTIHRGRIDILTGGFPCQPFSQSGLRKGKDDDRHLWPEMFRAIREIQPVWIVGENVLGLLTWSKGLVFNEVQTDLESAGYEIFPYVLPACGLNAPHQRERIWFIAHAVDNGHRDIREPNYYQDFIQGIRGKAIHAGKLNRTANVYDDSNTNISVRRKGGMHPEGPETATGYVGSRHARTNEGNAWDNFPTQPPLCRRSDGISNRMDRIKGLGNAWVPQVAYQIFKAIEEYENLTPTLVPGGMK